MWQNNNHILALKSTLRQFKKIPFYSVIIFDGLCELKKLSSVPEGTFIGYCEEIVEFVNSIIENNTNANYTCKKEIMKLLRECVENGNSEEIQNQHIENIKNKFDEDKVIYSRHLKSNKWVGKLIKTALR